MASRAPGTSTGLVEGWMMFCSRIWGAFIEGKRGVCRLSDLIQQAGALGLLLPPRVTIWRLLPLLWTTPLPVPDWWHLLPPHELGSQGFPRPRISSREGCPGCPWGPPAGPKGDCPRPS